MANERRIKRRIRSAKNIEQITKAMQMVAASKMRRAQANAVSGKPYAEKIAEITTLLVDGIDPQKHPLLKANTTGKRLIILVTTNKGLCGGLNTSLFRFLSHAFPVNDQKESMFISIGKKGEGFLVRQHLSLVADFSATVPFYKNIPALTKLVTDGYIQGEYRQVSIVYNGFVSPLVQRPAIKHILPITAFTIQTDKEPSANALPKTTEFVMEPSIDAILEALLFHYVENQIRDALLQAEASEHSARMFTMKNATENAKELIRVLTLEYNKARQEKITYEIADIITARVAVE